VMATMPSAFSALEYRRYSMSIDPTRRVALTPMLRSQIGPERGWPSIQREEPVCGLLALIGERNVAKPPFFRSPDAMVILVLRRRVEGG
jgi:hypothetical protein